MAPTKSKKSGASVVGAPAQHKQSSRKGKKSWRKNVDIEEVEEGMEGLRAEERITGTILQKQTDEQLFQIDTKGDEKIRKSMPRFSTSQLTSMKLVAQRSAVPAILSRPTPASNKRKAGSLSYEEKGRLLRIGKRVRRGPLNSIIDESEFGAGSAIMELSEAVKQSGQYDAWAEEEEQPELPEGMETVQKKVIKPPTKTHLKDAIGLPAIVEPHQGTSYNPHATAHQELLLQAHLVEERRVKEAERQAATKLKMDAAASTFVDETKEGVPPGMTVAELVDDEQDDLDQEELPKKKMPERKTKQQRAKAAKLLAQKRALAQRINQKRMLASVGSARAMRKANDRLARQQAAAREEKTLAASEKLRTEGLAGKKLGRHVVPQREVDVQLGEELSETLRGLKPEGNLFRDRFLSLQQRALIEPRVPVLPTKRKTGTKEYEKHAWKNFK